MNRFDGQTVFLFDGQIAGADTKPYTRWEQSRRDDLEELVCISFRDSTPPQNRELIVHYF